MQRTLGDTYTLERELGGGGMSRVFVATERSLGRSVVVKVLPTETAGQVSVERFNREIRLAASLQQANIVPVLSAGDGGGVPYYTMPFVKGESLRARLATKGALPIAECVAVLRDVARALAFAHGEGVVHRDIKPENILLSGGTAVVTDFGIAKAIAASSTQPRAPTLTQLGMALGTPAYMAPEQAVGEAVDHRADLYALGVVAYEMLTGTAPFAGRSAQAMLAAHAMEAPEPIAKKRADVPPRLAGLVARCMAKEQGDRPQSAGSVLEELETVTTPQAVSVVPATAAAKPSIAVLPLTNMSASADDEYFSDGITEDIIAQLSRIASLRVIARTSVMRYKKTGKSAREIASELGVANVVEGSVRRAGNKLRIVAQLIDAASEAPLWNETFDRDLADVFAIQSEVAQHISAALAATLTPGEMARVSGHRATTSLEAYDAYLRGRFEWNKGTPDGYTKSIGHFEQAIARDPDYAHAHVGLASVLCISAVFVADAAAVVERARTHVTRALQLDPTLPEAHATLGYIHFWFDWNWTEAARLFDRAIELGPNSAIAHNYRAVFLANLGSHDEGVAAAHRSIDLDPFWPTAHHDLGFTLFMAGAFVESVAACDRALELAPDYAPSLVMKGMSLTELGDLPGALVVHRRSAATSPGVSIAHAAIVVALARGGQAAEARRAVDEMRARSFTAPVQASALAWAHTAVGDADAAFACIERMIAEREPFTVSLATFRWWDPIRRDARFAAILDRFRFPERARAAADARRLAYAERAALPTATLAAARTRTRRWVVPGGVVAGVLGIVVGAQLLDSRNMASAEKTIAVIPGALEGSDTASVTFSEGMAETLINQLAKVPQLVVRSREASFALAGSHDSPAELGRKLNASTLLNVSVRRAGERLRVTVGLTRVADGAVVWSNQYDRAMKDVFAVQDEIAKTTVDSLRVTLGRAQRSLLTKHGTENAEAYDLYLRGRHAFAQGTFADYRRSTEYFERAIATDPAFALAHVGLADTKFFLARYGMARPRDVLPDARAAALRALQLDSTLAEAHASLGLIAAAYDWNWGEAEGQFRRALTLNPNSTYARMWYSGYVLSPQQRHEEAITQLRRALEIDPLSLQLGAALGMAYYYAGHTDSSVATFRRTLDLDHNFAPAHTALGFVYTARKQYDDAIREMKMGVADSAVTSDAVLGFVYALAGRKAEAHDILLSLRRRARGSYVTPMDFQLLFTGLGEPDSAFYWLNRAYEDRTPLLLWEASDVNDPKRRDPRFRSLLKNMGLRE
ncbi:MAG: protein kinase [Gemmatimonadales bacterium]